MTDHAHALVPVLTDEQWSAFHALREKVLFEDRGQFGVYDRAHPGDREPDNHPVLLLCGDRPIGAMRVDLLPERAVAVMRLVAVATVAQRRGHGRAMLALAEEFARERGCELAVVFAAEEAVGFYARCGYESEVWDPEEVYGGGVQMTKPIAAGSSRG